jgi:ribulose-phosphate 3-epimerase
MVSEPERHLQPFLAFAPPCIIFHQEATAHMYRCIEAIKHAGVGCELTLNPAKPPCWSEHVLQEIDLLLLMAVSPCLAGGTFAPFVMAKLGAARTMIDQIR